MKNLSLVNKLAAGKLNDCATTTVGVAYCGDKLALFSHYYRPGVAERHQTTEYARVQIEDGQVVAAAITWGGKGPRTPTDKEMEALRACFESGFGVPLPQ